jgi:hypothetical protein
VSDWFDIRPVDPETEDPGLVRYWFEFDLAGHTPTPEPGHIQLEPLWDAMERAGGLVDYWGGGEFCQIFPRVLAFIRSGAVGG